METQQRALAAKNHAAVIAGVIRFHEVMVRSSGNSALGLISGVLQDMSLKVYPKMLSAGSMGTRATVRKRTKQSAAAHSRLLNLITENKISQAEEFWRGYMENTAEFLARTGLGALQVELRNE